MPDTRINFVRQQGFRDIPVRACPLRYRALMFQPRAGLALMVLGVVSQSAWYWAALAIVLGWSAVLPRWNPFDAIWNGLLAGRKGRRRLPPAPAPRRFAQGLAGALTLIVAVSLFSKWTAVAWAVEAFLLTAVSALVFGRFCLGSWLFLHLRGEHAYAQQTAPWGSGEQLPSGERPSKAISTRYSVPRTGERDGRGPPDAEGGKP